jgi:hypothetical protein
MQLTRDTEARAAEGRGGEPPARAYARRIDCAERRAPPPASGRRGPLRDPGEWERSRPRDTSG